MTLLIVLYIIGFAVYTASAINELGPFEKRRWLWWLGRLAVTFVMVTSIVRLFSE